MNRRTAAIVVATAGLTLVPTAAMAYDAPGYDTTTTDPTPGVNQSFQITTNGTTAGDECTLTITSNPSTIPNDSIQIAGTKALAKTANGSSVSWSVTLTEAGTYTAAITDASGALIGDEVLTVVAADGSVPTGSLASTGFDPLGLAAGAGALVLAGAGAVAVARRRQTVRAKG